MEYDSIADLCVSIAREDDACYIMDEETGASSPVVASWEASRFESTDSWEHQAQSAASMQHGGATIAIVDQADIARDVSKSLSRVPSCKVSGPSIMVGRGVCPCRRSSDRGRCSCSCGRATIKVQGVLECHLLAGLAILHAQWMGRGCAGDGGRRHLFVDCHYCAFYGGM